MTGSGKNTNKTDWYLLKDEMTDTTVGYIDAEGNTRDTDGATDTKVRDAFNRDLLVENGEVVEELGMCFGGVCSVGPSDPGHDALVIRNLGALTGLRPEAPADDDGVEKPEP